MNEVIAFDDAEALTIKYLSEVLTGASVSSKPPTALTGPLVTVERAGGSRDGLITDSPLLIIQAWALNKADAYNLCKLARAYIGAMPGTKVNGTWIYKVEENSGPAWFPHPDHEWARYQFTVQVRTRGTAI